MYGFGSKMKRLSDKEFRMNEQAATVASTVLGQVEAATRCEQFSTKATQMYPAGGEVWSKQIPNGTGLPKSFVLAVTRTHIHALEDKQHRNDPVPGRVIKSWDRAGFRAHTGNNAMAALGHVPDDRQTLMLFLPIDGDSGRVAQAIAQQRAAAGQRISSHPYTFFIGKDGPSQRLIAALGAQPLTAPGAGPRISISEKREHQDEPGSQHHRRRSTPSGSGRPAPGPRTRRTATTAAAVHRPSPAGPGDAARRGCDFRR